MVYRRLLTVSLALAAFGPAAQAQQRGVVAPQAPGLTGIPLIPQLGIGAPLLMPNASSPLMPSLLPTLPTMATLATLRPVVTARPMAAGLPAAPGAARAALAAPGTPARAAKSVRGTLETTAEKLAPAMKGNGIGKALGLSTNLFDAGRLAADGEPVRPPDWSEDRRINAALSALGRSPIGASIYQNVYQNYGSTLKLKVDDDRNAQYDARLSWEAGAPVITLTENLVDRQSTEVIASYLAREMSDLYFQAIPASAERGYLAYSNMVRTYAELTNSDLSRYGRWWDTSKDQVSGGTYVMQRYYGSWKEAVEGYARTGAPVHNSPFFQFIRTRDDSNTDPASKMTLWELYQSGRINYATYSEMSRYFEQMVRYEAGWIRDTGR